MVDYQHGNWQSGGRRQQSSQSSKMGMGGGGGQKFQRKKVCVFCIEDVEHIDYKDMKRLRRFVTDRGKILPRRITGNCARHQKMLTRAVKVARNIALLPYKA